MSTAIYSHPDCALHEMGSWHPEAPERLRAIEDQLIAARLEGLVEHASAPLADEADILRNHTREALDLVRDNLPTVPGEHYPLDGDTLLCKDSYRAALRAAGAAVAATDAVIAGTVDNAFCAVRPPGHHARPMEPMGFCLFNNVAIAARRALDVHGLERVAIVDYDVHHGNGTQEIFYGDRRVLYVSTHQYPYYPGTGAAGEVGEGDGAGFTLNVPLEAGATDADYDLVFRSAIVPILDRFDPQLLFISAGFDADARDPLAGMRMSTAGFIALTGMLRDVAVAHCGGRLVLVAEGGYHLQALAEGLAATLDLVAGSEGRHEGRALPDRDEGGTRRGEAALEAVRGAQQPFWGAI
jgi:acetoin utilization deacetylase AcuC-like enzyme